MRRQIAILAMALLPALGAAPVLAQDPPPINAATEAVFGRLGTHAGVRQALDFLRVDDEHALRDQVELTEIPAPPSQTFARFSTSTWEISSGSSSPASSLPGKEAASPVSRGSAWASTRIAGSRTWTPSAWTSSPVP